LDYRDHRHDHLDHDHVSIHRDLPARFYRDGLLDLDGGFEDDWK
jgi:hypothetical protein